jgi:hypothetical protein
MSNDTPQQETPSIPWMYLGGFLVLFIGMAVSFFGGFFFAGGPQAGTPPDKGLGLGLAIVGIAVFAVGSFLLARAEQLTGKQMSMIFVTFLMTPLPSAVAIGIHFLGNYLRKNTQTAVQAILLGVGVFLLALAGAWAWDVSQRNTTSLDLRAFAWALLADLGVSALLLAALPLIARPAETGDAAEIVN